MSGKILQSILSVVVVVLISSLVIITGVLYQYFGNLQEDQLKDELKVVAAATEQLGENYLNRLKCDRYRLTWVDSNGKVRFDSHADVARMENHAGREEIKEALIYGAGSSLRRSSTLTEQTIYESTRLNDGSVLRISVSRATAVVLVLGMLPPIAAILVIAIILSAWLARRMAKKIVEPMNKLNLEKPMENKAYAELSPLLYRIHTQHLEIENQMQTLKQKKDEFDQIIGNMKESLILLDSSGKILSINPAARMLFDTDITCIGEDFLMIDRKSEMRLAIEKARKDGHADLRFEKRGREYQFDLSRIDSDGNEQGMVILAFDVTEQVNAERNRREFTANVSHELKTPLQAIIGSAELMENGIVKGEDIPKFVKRIRHEASRLVSLIDNIIRLSQLDEKIELHYEDVSLHLLAEEVCETLSDAAAMKDISLQVSGEEGIISGVRRLLYEIVYNLCDNAIKYNNPGGNVKIVIEQNEKEVCLSVQDNGIGISPEHHEKVFERFYRVDKSHSKQSGGTGLGLSIVKHAVQYHNGKISVKSAINKGTTMSVIFNTTA